MEPISNLIIDDVEYPVTSFSQDVQRLVAVRNQWAAELEKERSAVAKTEAALRQLDNELANIVTAELKAK